MNLDRFKYNKYSQRGDDGVIEELVKRLELTEPENSWCVEFGAWDGKFLSNTFLLIEKGWNAVHIEGDSNKFEELKKTQHSYPKIIAVNKFVSFDRNDENSLDSILATTPIPKNFDLLSIDIDSYDLDVWEGLKNYDPKIVVIEINNWIPPGVLWRHSKKTSGNSFSSTLNVALDKGYTLVCHTGNMIFVKSSLINKIGIEERYIKYPELLFNTDSLAGDLFNPYTGFGLFVKSLVPYRIRRALSGHLYRKIKQKFRR